MTTATPFRLAGTPPPGSRLCPYCEVVYAARGGTRCGVCGTKLIAMRAPTPGTAGSRPARHRVARANGRTVETTSGLTAFGRDAVRGFAQAAQSWWGAPLWVTVLAIGLALSLDRLIAFSDHVALLSLQFDGQATGDLLLIALVSFGGGLLIGSLLRGARIACAVLAGLIVALVPLGGRPIAPVPDALVFANLLLWATGSWLAGRRR